MQRRKQQLLRYLMISLALSFSFILISPALGSTNLTSPGNVKVLSNVTYIPPEPTDFPNNDSDFFACWAV